MLSNVVSIVENPARNPITRLKHTLLFKFFLHIYKKNDSAILYDIKAQT